MKVEILPEMEDRWIRYSLIDIVGMRKETRGLEDMVGDDLRYQPPGSTGKHEIVTIVSIDPQPDGEHEIFSHKRDKVLDQKIPNSAEVYV